MGSITKGILGPVRGKVGTVVGSSWNGIEYIRAYVATRTSATSPAQETQQAKFALVNSFVKSMKPFLEISYKAAAKKNDWCQCCDFADLQERCHRHLSKLHY